MLKLTSKKEKAHDVLDVLIKFASFRGNVKDFKTHIQDANIVIEICVLMKSEIMFSEDILELSILKICRTFRFKKFHSYFVDVIKITMKVIATAYEQSINTAD